MRAAAILFAAIVAAGPATAMSDFDKAILDTHNKERIAIGVPPLTWSDKLATDAAGWAAHLAKLGHPEHSKAEDRNHEGESLWVGTAGGYTPEEMVQGWIAEKAYFVNGAFPGIVKTQDWRAVGHYSQLIWRNTKEVGCAKASMGQWDLLVCRYNPEGNLIGERPY